MATLEQELANADAAAKAAAKRVRDLRRKQRARDAAARDAEALALGRRVFDARDAGADKLRAELRAIRDELRPDDGAEPAPAGDADYEPGHFHG